MKIGILNEFLNNLEFSFGFEGSSRQLDVLTAGNPLSGEALSIPWQVARNSPIELSVKLPENCFVDCVEMVQRVLHSFVIQEAEPHE